MIRCRLLVAVLMLGLGAAVAVAASYSWVGLGADDDWDTCDNWAKTGLGGECYPSSTNDDATIPVSESTWTIDLIEVDEMDDLTILSSVDFDTAGGSVTVEVDTLTIDASGGDVTVTFTSNATIKMEKEG
ncbi:MAG: hypothetical protein KKB50_05465 [Planctomycetes bacterium]|nr:hypothetical protein [Planctomycetota bacterium]